MTTPSDDLKQVSIDSLVTKLKLSTGSTLIAYGKTTPDELPYVFLLAIDRHNTGVTNAVLDFAAKAPAISRANNLEGWAQLHRAELQAKKELGDMAPSLKLIARMQELLTEWGVP